MNRVFTVAVAELLALVKTKFFILGVLLVPLMIAVFIGFQTFAEHRSDLVNHRFAVIDRTGVLYPVIARAADEHNKEAGTGSSRRGAHFVAVEAPAAGESVDEVRLELSRRVRAEELIGFVDIPETVLEVGVRDPAPVQYYTETPTFDDLPDWLEATVNREIARQRFARASIDPELADRLTEAASMTTLGLVERDADGGVVQAREVNELQTFGLPFVLMYVLFLAVMMSAPHMMNAVIEEKMSRISEVLLASVTPFQLLAGKLIGIATLSVLLAMVYIGGGAYAALAWGEFGLMPPALMAWFLLFLLAAVLIFGSVFLAIGAACSDLKDAQSMVQPAMFFLLMPMFAAIMVMRAPNSTLSVVVSMIPTATPFLMLVRLAMTPPPPAWQVWASVVLTLTTAAVFVWAAGRIFRVGLLMQGKAPNLPELMKWIRR